MGAGREEEKGRRSGERGRQKGGALGGALGREEERGVGRQTGGQICRAGGGRERQTERRLERGRGLGERTP